MIADGEYVARFMFREWNYAPIRSCVSVSVMCIGLTKCNVASKTLVMQEHNHDQCLGKQEHNHGLCLGKQERTPGVFDIFGYSLPLIKLTKEQQQQLKNNHVNKKENNTTGNRRIILTPNRSQEEEQQQEEEHKQHVHIQSFDSSLFPMAHQCQSWG